MVARASWWRVAIVAAFTAAFGATPAVWAACSPNEREIAPIGERRGTPSASPRCALLMPCGPLLPAGHDVRRRSRAPCARALPRWASKASALPSTRASPVRPDAPTPTRSAVHRYPRIPTSRPLKSTRRRGVETDTRLTTARRTAPPAPRCRWGGAGERPVWWSPTGETWVLAAAEMTPVGAMEVRNQYFGSGKRAGLHRVAVSGEES